MKAFEAQRQEMEDELDVIPSKSEKAAVSVGKLDASKTKFDSLEQKRAEQRLQELQEQRMKDLQGSFSTRSMKKVQTTTLESPKSTFLDLKEKKEVSNQFQKNSQPVSKNSNFKNSSKSSEK